MATQSASLKRCASCNRWDGARATGDAPGTVVVADENECGRCVGGPWDGETRRARAACGRWTPWEELKTTDAPGNRSTS